MMPVSAFALLGQFQSFVSILQFVSGGIVTYGIVKYISEYEEKPEVLKKILKSGFQIALILSFLIGLLGLLLSYKISFALFHTKQYAFSIMLLSLTLFLYVVNKLVLSILNGLSEIKYYALLSGSGAVILAICVITLGYCYGIQGAFVGFSIAQIFTLMISVTLLVLKSGHLLPARTKLFEFVRSFDLVWIKRLALFSVMTIVSSIALPVSQIVIRLYVAKSSWVDVGYWQALIRISDGYLLIIGNLITLVALPLFSKRVSASVLRKNVYATLFKLVMLELVLIILVFLLRDWIVRVLFSEKYLLVTHLFFYQLLGDLFKVASFVLGTVLIAKTKVKIFVTLEIITSLMYIGFSMLCYYFKGIYGLPLAFMIVYIIQFIANLIVFRVYTNDKNITV